MRRGRLFSRCLGRTSWWQQRFGSRSAPSTSGSAHTAVRACCAILCGKHAEHTERAAPPYLGQRHRALVAAVCREEVKLLLACNKQQQGARGPNCNLGRWYSFCSPGAAIEQEAMQRIYRANDEKRVPAQSMSPCARASAAFTCKHSACSVTQLNKKQETGPHRSSSGWWRPHQRPSAPAPQSLCCSTAAARRWPGIAQGRHGRWRGVSVCHVAAKTPIKALPLPGG